ncbi:MAG: metal/formaldehyde-sensitive transcriptional repressor [Planctomycetota bacterium]
MHTSRDRLKLLNRIRRIRGQIDGIERELGTHAHDCYRILQTIAACRGAVTGLMAEVLEGHVRQHIIDQRRSPTAAERDAIEGLVAVVRSFLK